MAHLTRLMSCSEVKRLGTIDLETLGQLVEATDSKEVKSIQVSPDLLLLAICRPQVR
jgi:hypothetical protein